MPNVKISDLVALTPPALADLLAIVDITADETKKITVQNLMKIVNLLTALTAPAAADVLPIYDDNVGETKKITSLNLMKAVSLLVALGGAPVAADVFLVYDDDASAAKKVTFTNLAAAIHFASGTVMLFGQDAAPTGWTRKDDWQDNAMLCYASAGNIGSGGATNPQSAHTHSVGGKGVKTSQGSAAGWVYTANGTTLGPVDVYDSDPNSAPHYQEVIAATKD